MRRGKRDLTRVELCLQALWPLGGPASNPADRVQDFFLSYLAAPVFLFFLVTGYAINRTWPLRASEIDIDVRSSSSLSLTLFFGFSLSGRG